MAASKTAFSLKGDIQLFFSDSTLKKANQQIAQTAARIQGRTQNVNRSLGALAANVGTTFGIVAAGFGASAVAAAKFEESFVAVKKTLNIAGDAQKVEAAFDSIATSLLNLTKISPVTAQELNQIAAVGGQLGIAANDIVKFTQVIQKLTIATNLGAEDAALAMARLQEITGRGVSELDNLGAVLVDLGNNFAATESEITNASLQIATATAQVSGNLNNAAVDALAFSTALRAIGQPAQAGATAIVRLMTDMSQAVVQGGESLELFATTAGMSASDFRQLFGVDSTKAISLFIKGLDQASIAGMTNVEVLTRLGLNQVRTRKAILALSKAHQTLFDAIDTANNAYIENAALNIEAERRYDTLYSKVQQLKNIFSAGIIDFSRDNKSLDYAKSSVETLTNLTQAVMDNLDKILKVTVPITGTIFTLRTAFGLLEKNTANMASNLGLSEISMKGIATANSILAKSGFAIGESNIEKEDFEKMGLDIYKGSQITRGDKFRQAIPSIFGKLAGISTGSAKRQQDAYRQDFFSNNRGADAFMQGSVGYIANLRNLGMDELVDELAKTGLEVGHLADVLSEENLINALKGISKERYDSLSMMTPEGLMLDQPRAVSSKEFNMEEIAMARMYLIQQEIDKQLAKGISIPQSNMNDLMLRINVSMYNLYSKLEQIFSGGIKATLNRLKSNFSKYFNPMEELGLLVNKMQVLPDAFLGRGAGAGAEYPGGFDFNPKTGAIAPTLNNLNALRALKYAPAMEAYNKDYMQGKELSDIASEMVKESIAAYNAIRDELMRIYLGKMRKTSIKNIIPKGLKESGLDNTVLGGTPTAVSGIQDMMNLLYEDAFRDKGGLFEFTNPRLNIQTGEFLKGTAFGNRNFFSTSIDESGKEVVDLINQVPKEGFIQLTQTDAINSYIKDILKSFNDMKKFAGSSSYTVAQLNSGLKKLSEVKSEAGAYLLSQANTEFDKLAEASVLSTSSVIGNLNEMDRATETGASLLRKLIADLELELGRPLNLFPEDFAIREYNNPYAGTKDGFRVPTGADIPTQIKERGFTEDYLAELSKGGTIRERLNLITQSDTMVSINDFIFKYYIGITTKIEETIGKISAFVSPIIAKLQAKGSAILEKVNVFLIKYYSLITEKLNDMLVKLFNKLPSFDDLKVLGGKALDIAKNVGNFIKDIAAMHYLIDANDFRIAQTVTEEAQKIKEAYFNDLNNLIEARGQTGVKGLPFPNQMKEAIRYQDTRFPRPFDMTDNFIPKDSYTGIGDFNKNLMSYYDFKIEQFMKNFPGEEIPPQILEDRIIKIVRGVPGDAKDKINPLDWVLPASQRRIADMYAGDEGKIIERFVKESELFPAKGLRFRPLRKIDFLDSLDEVISPLPRGPMGYLPEYLKGRFTSDLNTQTFGRAPSMDINMTLRQYMDNINSFYEGVAEFVAPFKEKVKSFIASRKSFSQTIDSLKLNLDKFIEFIKEKVDVLKETNTYRRLFGGPELPSADPFESGPTPAQAGFFGNIKNNLMEYGQGIKEALARRKVQSDYNALKRIELKFTEKILAIEAKRLLANSKLTDLVSSDVSDKAQMINITKGLSDKENIDNLLDSIYGGTGEGFFGKMAKRKRRKIALRGGLQQVNDVMGILGEMGPDDFFKDFSTKGSGVVEINKSMLKSFTRLGASVGRVTSLIAGLLKGFSLLGLAALTLAPLVKFISKIGAQSRGNKEFVNTLREVTDGMQEYRVELYKVAQAEKLRDEQAKVIGGTTSQAYESIVEYIDKQNTALKNQRKQMSESLGTSFLTNIAENLVSQDSTFMGMRAEGGIGSYIDSVISQLAIGRSSTEELVRKQIAEPIGNAMYNVIEGGEIPTLGDIFENLMFSDLPTDKEKGVLSGFFTGFTRDLLESSGIEQSTDEAFKYFNNIFEQAIIEGAVAQRKAEIEAIARNQAISGSASGASGVGTGIGILLSQGGFEFDEDAFRNNFKEEMAKGEAVYFDLIGEMYQDITGFINDYTGRGLKGRDVFAEIGRGDFTGLGMGEGAKAFIKELEEQIRASKPTATDDQIGQAIYETLSFYEVYGALTGKSIGQLKDLGSLSEEIDLDAPMFKPMIQLLEVRLQELEQAGYITKDQMLDAQGNFEDMFKVFNEGMGKVEKETIQGIDDLNNTLGISAEMSAKLAIKMSEAFKSMRSEISQFGKEVAKQQFTRRSLGDLLNDLRQQSQLQNELEANASKLRLQGYQMVADRILTLGPGGADLASRLVNDSQAAVLMEQQLREMAPSDATTLGVTSNLVDNDFLNQMKAAGMDIANGLLEGLESGYPMIMEKFGNLGEDIIQALKDALDEHSPSMEAFRVSENVLLGLALAVEKSPETKALLDAYYKLGEEIPAAVALGMQNNPNLFFNPFGPGNQAPDNYGNPDQSLNPNALIKPTSPGFTGKKITQYRSPSVNNLADGYKSGGLYIDTAELEKIFNKYGADLGRFTNSMSNIQNSLDAYTAQMYNTAQQNISNMQEAWSLVTDLTNAERAYNQSVLGVLNAKQSVAKTLREEASLTDRIAETKERLDKLEIEGRKNNITTKERIGLLQQLISLRDMEKKAAGEYDARTALSIQQKEQEVANLALMYDRGVITQLDFQAAQEELAELKGEFKTVEEKELFFLQLADAEAEYLQATEDAKKVDKDLISVREEYLSLLDEQERKSAEVTVAQDTYRGSLENTVTSHMAMNQEFLKFNETSPLYLEELSKIKDRYGEITDEVDELIDSVKEYHAESSKAGIDSARAIGGEGSLAADEMAGANVEGAKDEAGNQIAALVEQNASQSFEDFANTIAPLLSGYGGTEYVEDLINQGRAGGLIQDKRLQSDLLMDSLDYTYQYNPATGNVEKVSQSDEKDQYINDEQLKTLLARQARLDNTASRSFEDNLDALLESLGINLEKGAEGNRIFDEDNLKVIEKELAAAGSKFKIRDFIDILMRSGAVATTDNLYPQSSIDLDDDSGSSTTPPTPGPGESKGTAITWDGIDRNLNKGLWYKTSFGEMLGQQLMDLINSGVPVRKGAMGLRIPGFKMGGRIPDMSHMQPKKYAMGGRDNMMRRALVGEYGPEEVRFVPGSGFLVKPLTQGGRGNNTIVQSLSVNVTGIPVDNASARKAAMQIKKALQRLEREGRAGGGVRNT